MSDPLPDGSPHGSRGGRVRPCVRRGGCRPASRARPAGRGGCLPERLAAGATIALCLLLHYTTAFAQCAPILGTITPGATSLSVSWTGTCGGPGSIELRWYNNGANYTVLGTQGPLTTLQNGGAVSSGAALRTGMLYSPLELCAIYGKPPAASTSCGIQFGGVPENPLGQPLPVITYSSPTQTEIDYSRETFPSYSDYNVTITGLPQQNTTAGSFAWRYPRRRGCAAGGARARGGGARVRGWVDCEAGRGCRDGALGTGGHGALGRWRPCPGGGRG